MESYFLMNDSLFTHAITMLYAQVARSVCTGFGLNKQDTVFQLVNLTGVGRCIFGLLTEPG